MFKLRIFDAYEKFLFNVWGPQIRSLGQRLNHVGIGIQGHLATDDRLVPSLRNKGFHADRPTLNHTDFIAPNSAIIGQVKVGEHSSIWYGSTLRGDKNAINIGKHTVIQDLVSLIPRKGATQVGDNVYVGPNCTLESCTIESNSFIGMGASLREGVKVESYGVVAAGSVVPENTTIPSYQIWAGNPARYLRDLTNEEKEVLDEFQTEMQSLAKVHAEETEKPFRQVIDEIDNREEYEIMDAEEVALGRMRELGFPTEAQDEDYAEQRMFMKERDHPEEQYWKKHYDPYEQDVFNFPDSFKVYGENFQQYEDIKKYFEQNPDSAMQILDRTEKKVPEDQTPWTRRL